MAASPRHGLSKRIQIRSCTTTDMEVRSRPDTDVFSKSIRKNQQLQARISKARRKKIPPIENQHWEEILKALCNSEAEDFRRTYKRPQIRSDTTSHIDNPCRWHKGEPDTIMDHMSTDASGNPMFPVSLLNNYQTRQAQPWSYAPSRPRRSVTNAEIEAGGSLTRSSSVTNAHRFVSGAHAQQLRTCLLEQPGYEMALEDIYRWFRENTDRDLGALDAFQEARHFNPHIVGRHGTVDEVTERHGKAAGEEYKKLLETAAGLRKGWQCGVRHNLSQNDGFEKVPGKKGHWRLTQQGVDGVLSTTSYRKDRETKNGHPFRAKAKRELSESERQKRRDAGSKGGKASANSRRNSDEQKQPGARRSNRSRGQRVTYNENAMMTTPDLDLAMQLDFNAYPDSFGNLDHQDFDASRFDHMRSNGSYAGSMPSMSTGTTPSSFSNTAPPSLQDCDSLFWSPYPSLGNDITMDISTYPSAGYEQAAADFTGGTQPATRQDWTNPYAAASSIYIISSQLIGAEDNNNNKFFDPYVPVSAMNASYQPAHLYDSSDPSYPPSISMTAFSHTASPAEKMPSASPGLDNGYLTTPASSGRKYVANHRTMGPMQYCQGSSARSGRQPRTQQGSRANGYAPMIPSGLSRTSTPAMSPGLGQVQVGSVVDVGGAGIGDVQDAQSWNIDPQLYEAGELFSGSGDGNVMEEAVSSADTAEYMDFVTRT